MQRQLAWLQRLYLPLKTGLIRGSVHRGPDWGSAEPKRVDVAADQSCGGLAPSLPSRSSRARARSPTADQTMSPNSPRLVRTADLRPRSCRVGCIEGLAASALTTTIGTKAPEPKPELVSGPVGHKHRRGGQKRRTRKPITPQRHSHDVSTLGPGRAAPDRGSDLAITYTDPYVADHDKGPSAGCWAHASNTPRPRS